MSRKTQNNQKVVDLEETKSNAVEEETKDNNSEEIDGVPEKAEKSTKWRSILKKIGIIGAIGAAIGAAAYFGGKSSGEEAAYKALAEKGDSDGTEEASEENSDSEDDVKITEF